MLNHRHHRMLSVWFFIGVLLFVYGVIITYIGVRDFHRASRVVLAQYHAPLWGGVLLLALGVIYTFFNWPRRNDM
jgi:uncharacterized membrane protein YoaK (UPF0700 family)